MYKLTRLWNFLSSLDLEASFGSSFVLYLVPSQIGVSLLGESLGRCTSDAQEDDVSVDVSDFSTHEELA